MRILQMGWVLASVSLPLLGCSKSQSPEQAAPAASAAASIDSSVAQPVESAVAKPARRSRSKLTCEELISKTVKMGQTLKMPVKVTPASWGKVPKAVQVLPPDGALCGSVDLLDQAMITTKLEGEELKAFYGPLFAQAECEPLTCEDVTEDRAVQTRCTCNGDGFLGSATTDTSAESVTIGIVETKFSRKGQK